MYIEIPSFAELTPEQQARETERVLREIRNKTNEALEDLRLETNERLRRLEEILNAES